MNELLVCATTAYLIGLGTALHPCPLSTNLTMFALLSSWATYSSKRVLYLLAFITAYVLCLMLLVTVLAQGFLAFDELARMTQSFSRHFMGPVLILVGMMQTGLLSWQQSQFDTYWAKIEKRKPHIARAALLGFFFALAFCPATAALFFGVLLPLAISQEAVYIVALCYGLGVLTPLLVLLWVVLRSVQSIDRAHGQERVFAKRCSLFFGSMLILTGLVLLVSDIFVYG